MWGSCGRLHFSQGVGVGFPEKLMFKTKSKGISQHGGWGVGGGIPAKEVANVKILKWE